MNSGFPDNLNKPALRGFFVFALFALVSFCLYAPAIKGPFYLDDSEHIDSNPKVKITNPSPSALWEAARSGASSHRPVPMISFALDYMAHGVNPAGYRITNIILHSLCGLVLFLFLQTTFAMRPGAVAIAFPAAFLSAFFWLCHPVETQAVSYIVQRMASLSALFFILTLFCYARARTCEDVLISVWFYMGAAFSMVLALGSKENAAVLPFFILLYEWFFFRDLSPRFFWDKLHWIILAVAVFVMTAFIYSGFDFSGTLASSYSIRDFSLAQRLFTQARVIVYYLSLFLAPLPGRLTLFHDFPVSSGLFSPESTMLSIIFLITLLGAAIFSAKRLRLFSFFVLFFFGTLAIESSAVGLEIIFEHRLYLPSAALAPLFVLFVFSVFKHRSTAIAAICLITLVFSSATFARNRLWGDGHAFYADAVEKNPGSARTWTGLAFSLMQANRPHEAYGPYKKAVEMDRAFITERLNKGKALVAQGRKAEGMDYFKKAYYSYNRYLDNVNGLAGVLAATGRTREAIALWKELLREAPYHSLGRINLGSVLLAMKEPEKAALEFQAILRNSPENPTVMLLLGDALLASGRFSEAADLYRRTARIDQHTPGIWERLAKIQEREEAYAAFNAPETADPEILAILKELDKNPGNAALYNRLGVLYRERGLAEKALETLEKALALAPGSPVVLNNLGLAQLDRKHYPAALETFETVISADPKNLAAHYNMVCLYSVKNEPAKAALWLEKLFGLGFSDIASMKADKDLKNFADTRLFEKTVKKHAPAASLKEPVKE